MQKVRGRVARESQSERAMSWFVAEVFCFFPKPAGLQVLSLDLPLLGAELGDSARQNQGHLHCVGSGLGIV